MREKADHVLDATGLYCPEPVMLLHNRVRDLAPGETLLLIATDPSTKRDVPKFCNFLGHPLLEEDELDGAYHYLLQRGE